MQLEWLYGRESSGDPNLTELKTRVESSEDNLKDRKTSLSSEARSVLEINIWELLVCMHLKWDIIR